MALKVPIAGRPTRAAVDAAWREAGAHSRLRHPHILRLLDLEQVDRIPILVMPIGRGSLAERIRRPFPLRKALGYAHQLLLALGYMHRRHVLHCDIKPENLILLHDGTLALADFGIARRGRRTVNGDGSGTRGYMAPEQARGRPSARSDVFSAAMVLATMLLGFFSKDPIGQLRRRRRLPPGLPELIQRALDPDPRRRHRDAVEMLDALRLVERRLDRRRAKTKGGARQVAA
jgi:serine/threonine-protein kinase